MSSPKPPKAPDYVGQAYVQGQQNIEAARTNALLNQYNTSDPYGQTNWTTNGTDAAGNPIRTQTTTLSPEQQAIFDTDQRTQQQVGNISEQLANGVSSNIGSVANTMGSEFNLDGLAPQRATNVTGQSYDRMDSGTGAPTSTSLNTGTIQPRSSANYQTSLNYNGAPTYNPQGLTENVDTSKVGDMKDYGYQTDLDLSNLSSAPNLDAIKQYLYQNNIDTSGLEAIPNVAGRGQQVQDTLYNSGAKTLDPQWQQQEDQMRTRLLNSGLQPGTKAYTDAFNQMSQQRTAAYGDLRDRSILAAGQEENRLLDNSLKTRSQQLGELLSTGQFANDATGRQASTDLAGRQQTFNEGMALRDQGLNEKLTAGNFKNSAASQGNATEMSRRAQQMGEALDLGNFTNSSRNANNQTALQARQQGIDETNNQAQFANDAADRVNTQGLNTRNQDFNELLTQANFGNQAAQQALDAKLAEMGFNRDAQTLEYGQDLTSAQQQNDSRQQGLQEMLLQRQLPQQEMLQLISALGLGNGAGGSSAGSGVGGSQGIAPVDIMGAIQNQAAAQQNAYNNSVATNNSNMGAGAAVASAAIIAA